MKLMDKIKRKNNGQGTSDGAAASAGNVPQQHQQIGLEIKLPGCDEFVPLGRAQYNRRYLDDIGPRLLIVCDECAELLEPSGVKSTEGKEEDALKQEMVGLIKSITQLGRSSGIHMVLATQRNDASIIPGVIQNNPLGVNTKLRIRRKVK